MEQVVCTPVFDELFAEIKWLARGREKPLIVCVCGGTSTGKSSIVAKALTWSLNPSEFEVIALDNFQQGISGKANPDVKYGYDTPDYFNVMDCARTIERMSKGESATIPVYDFRKGISTGEMVLLTKPMLVFEGLFAGHEAIRHLAQRIIYVESPLYARLLRRILRNRFERYNADYGHSLQSFLRTLPAHRDLVQPQKSVAHRVVCTPYQFEDSILRYKLIPIMAKPKVNLTYRYNLSSFTHIGTYTLDGSYYLNVCHCGKVYIHIELTAEVHNQLLSLNFEEK